MLIVLVYIINLMTYCDKIFKIKNVNNNVNNNDINNIKIKDNKNK